MKKIRIKLLTYLLLPYNHYPNRSFSTNKDNCCSLFDQKRKGKKWSSYVNAEQTLWQKRRACDEKWWAIGALRGKHRHDPHVHHKPEESPTLLTAPSALYTDTAHDTAHRPIAARSHAVTLHTAASSCRHQMAHTLISFSGVSCGVAAVCEWLMIGLWSLSVISVELDSMMMRRMTMMYSVHRLRYIGRCQFHQPDFLSLHQP